jgi:hypothetical protein
MTTVAARPMCGTERLEHAQRSTSKSPCSSPDLAICETYTSAEGSPDGAPTWRPTWAFAVELLSITWKEWGGG